MVGKNKVSIPVPAIGNGQRQMFDSSQAKQRKCECWSECFDKVFMVGVISKLAPGNRANQDIIIEVPIYVCHMCGKELNPMEEQGSKNG